MQPRGCARRSARYERKGHVPAPAAFSAGFSRCARMRTDTFCAASPKLGSASTRFTIPRSPSAVILPAQEAPAVSAIPPLQKV